MATKLNSMRLLEKHNIAYEVTEFPNTERDAGKVIASILGIPPAQVYKTLVVEPLGGENRFWRSWPQTVTWIWKEDGCRFWTQKVGMAAHADAEKLTGLKVGGISALALTHKNWAVYLDQPAAQLDHILVSAGQRGMDLQVPTAAFIRVVNAKLADISIG